MIDNSVKNYGSSQKSINDPVDLVSINNILLAEKQLFKDIYEKSKDIYVKELCEQLEKNNRLDFPISKHMELFIFKNKKNINKVIRYIIFRYKFHISGKKK